MVQTGSRNEVEPGHTGFAHLFEHLMFKGTKTYPQEKYTETLRRIGASSNAFTTDDFTCYYTVFSKEDLPTVIAMEADRFQNLKYTEPEFKTETLAVLGEYNKNSSNPGSKLDEVLADTAFDRHTYKHTTMGFLKDIQDMPNQYEYSLKFFDRYYRPEYTTILVVGDVKAKAVRELVDKSWGEWKRGSYKPEIPAEPPQEAPRTAKVDWQGATLPIVTIAFKARRTPIRTRTPPRSTRSRSWRFRELRTFTRSSSSRNRRSMSLGADRPEPGGSRRCSPSARASRRRPTSITFATRFSRRSKRSRRSRWMPPGSTRSASTCGTSWRSAWTAATRSPRPWPSYVALQRTPETLNRLYEQYAALTPEDVQKAASKYLVENGRTTVTLTAAQPRGGSQ